MSLRTEIRDAVDEITPSAPALLSQVEAFVNANTRRRVTTKTYSKRFWRGAMRGSLAMVAVLVVVALVAAVLAGGRLVQDWNSHHNPAPAGQRSTSQLAQLEARPLHLPSYASARDCQSGPFNAEGSYGSGPVYGDGGGTVNTTWGIYYQNSAYADAAIDGPILVRARDIFTNQTIVFVGNFASGRVVGTDTVDGQVHQQRTELVLFTDQVAGAPHSVESGHKFVWQFIAGAPMGWSGSSGWQIDGLAFSETFVVC